MAGAILLITITVLTFSGGIDHPPEGAEVQIVEIVNGSEPVIRYNDKTWQINLLGYKNPDVNEINLDTGLPFREEARRLLLEIVDGQKINIEFEPEKLDQYRRLSAYLIVGGEINLSEKLIRQGFSKFETGDSPCARYAERLKAAEDEARQNKLRRWGKP